MSDDVEIDPEAAAKWEADQGPDDSFFGGVVDTIESGGEAVIDGVESVVDMFRPETVEAEAPDLSDIPASPEETTMRSSSVAQDEAPPHPAEQ
jgi:hypothetical protein